MASIFSRPRCVKFKELHADVESNIGISCAIHWPACFCIEAAYLDAPEVFSQESSVAATQNNFLVKTRNIFNVTG